MAEPDPPRGVPTIVWWMLGLIVIAAFAAILFALRGHVEPRALGPPPGTP